MTKGPQAPCLPATCGADRTAGHLSSPQGSDEWLSRPGARCWMLSVRFLGARQARNTAPTDPSVETSTVHTATQHPTVLRDDTRRDKQNGPPATRIRS